MRRLWIFISGFLEDAKGIIQLVPLFLGLVLLLCARKLTQLLVGTEKGTVLGPLIIACVFLLWGIQGIIFAAHKEFPFFMDPLRNKAAVLLGVVWAILCFLISSWAIIVAVSRL